MNPPQFSQALPMPNVTISQLRGGFHAAIISALQFFAILNIVAIRRALVMNSVFVPRLWSNAYAFRKPTV